MEYYCADIFGNHHSLLGQKAIFYDAGTTGDMVSAILAILVAKEPVMGATACAVGVMYFMAVNRVNKRMRKTVREKIVLKRCSEKE